MAMGIFEREAIELPRLTWYNADFKIHPGLTDAEGA